MRVLVVDDDPDIREAVGQTLRFRWPDCEVVTADGGDEGLRAFNDEQPEVVVLDIGLPVMSGLDVLRAIRESLQYARADADRAEPGRRHRPGARDGRR